jgi:hypothetical protein
MLVICYQLLHTFCVLPAQVLRLKESFSAVLSQKLRGKYGLSAGNYPPFPNRIPRYVLKVSIVLMANNCEYSVKSLPLMACLLLIIK